MKLQKIFLVLALVVLITNLLGTHLSFFRFVDAAAISCNSGVDDSVQNVNLAGSVLTISKIENCDVYIKNVQVDKIEFTNPGPFDNFNITFENVRCVSTTISSCINFDTFNFSRIKDIRIVNVSMSADLSAGAGDIYLVKFNTFTGSPTQATSDQRSVLTIKNSKLSCSLNGSSTAAINCKLLFIQDRIFQSSRFELINNTLDLSAITTKTTGGARSTILAMSASSGFKYMTEILFQQNKIVGGVLEADGSVNVVGFNLQTNDGVKYWECSGNQIVFDRIITQASLESFMMNFGKIQNITQQLILHSNLLSFGTTTMELPSLQRTADAYDIKVHTLFASSLIHDVTNTIDLVNNTIKIQGRIDNNGAGVYVSHFLAQKMATRAGFNLTDNKLYILAKNSTEIHKTVTFDFRITNMQFEREIYDIPRSIVLTNNEIKTTGIIMSEQASVVITSFSQYEYDITQSCFFSEVDIKDDLINIESIDTKTGIEVATGVFAPNITALSKGIKCKNCSIVSPAKEKFRVSATGTIAVRTFAFKGNITANATQGPNGFKISVTDSFINLQSTNDNRTFFSKLKNIDFAFVKFYQILDSPQEIDVSRNNFFVSGWVDASTDVFFSAIVFSSVNKPKMRLDEQVSSSATKTTVILSDNTLFSRGQILSRGGFAAIQMLAFPYPDEPVSQITNISISNCHIRITNAFVQFDAGYVSHGVISSTTSSIAIASFAKGLNETASGGGVNIKDSSVRIFGTHPTTLNEIQESNALTQNVRVESEGTVSLSILLIDSTASISSENQGFILDNVTLSSVETVAGSGANAAVFWSSGKHYNTSVIKIENSFLNISSFQYDALDVALFYINQGIQNVTGSAVTIQNNTYEVWSAPAATTLSSTMNLITVRRKYTDWKYGLLVSQNRMKVRVRNVKSPIISVFFVYSTAANPDGVPLYNFTNNIIQASVQLSSAVGNTWVITVMLQSINITNAHQGFYVENNEIENLDVITSSTGNVLVHHVRIADSTTSGFVNMSRLVVTGNTIHGGSFVGSQGPMIILFFAAVMQNITNQIQFSNNQIYNVEANNTALTAQTLWFCLWHMSGDLVLNAATTVGDFSNNAIHDRIRIDASPGPTAVNVFIFSTYKNLDDDFNSFNLKSNFLEIDRVVANSSITIYVFRAYWIVNIPQGLSLNNNTIKIFSSSALAQEKEQRIYSEQAAIDISTIGILNTVENIPNFKIINNALLISADVKAGEVVQSSSCNRSISVGNDTKSIWLHVVKFMSDVKNVPKLTIADNRLQIENPVKITSGGTLALRMFNFAGVVDGNERAYPMGSSIYFQLKGNRFSIVNNHTNRAASSSSSSSSSSNSVSNINITSVTGTTHLVLFYHVSRVENFRTVSYQDNQVFVGADVNNNNIVTPPLNQFDRKAEVSTVQLSSQADELELNMIEFVSSAWNMQNFIVTGNSFQVSSKNVTNTHLTLTGQSSVLMKILEGTTAQNTTNATEICSNIMTIGTENGVSSTFVNASSVSIISRTGDVVVQMMKRSGSGLMQGLMFVNSSNNFFAFNNNKLAISGSHTEIISSLDLVKIDLLVFAIPVVVHDNLIGKFYFNQTSLEISNSASISGYLGTRVSNLEFEDVIAPLTSYPSSGTSGCFDLYIQQNSLKLLNNVSLNSTDQMLNVSVVKAWSSVINYNTLYLESNSIELNDESFTSSDSSTIASQLRSAQKIEIFVAQFENGLESNSRNQISVASSSQTLLRSFNNSVKLLGNVQNTNKNNNNNPTGLLATDFIRIGTFNVRNTLTIADCKIDSKVELDDNFINISAVNISTDRGKNIYDAEISVNVASFLGDIVNNSDGCFPSSGTSVMYPSTVPDRAKYLLSASRNNLIITSNSTILPYRFSGISLSVLRIEGAITNVSGEIYIPNANEPTAVLIDSNTLEISKGSRIVSQGGTGGGLDLNIIRYITISIFTHYTSSISVCSVPWCSRVGTTYSFSSNQIQIANNNQNEISPTTMTSFFLPLVQSAVNNVFIAETMFGAAYEGLGSYRSNQFRIRAHVQATDYNGYTNAAVCALIVLQNITQNAQQVLLPFNNSLKLTISESTVEATFWKSPSSGSSTNFTLSLIYFTQLGFQAVGGRNLGVDSPFTATIEKCKISLLPPTINSNSSAVVQHVVDNLADAIGIFSFKSALPCQPSRCSLVAIGTPDLNQASNDNQFQISGTITFSQNEILASFASPSLASTLAPFKTIFPFSENDNMTFVSTPFGDSKRILGPLFGQTQPGNYFNVTFAKNTLLQSFRSRIVWSPAIQTFSEFSINKGVWSFECNEWDWSVFENFRSLTRSTGTVKLIGGCDTASRTMNTQTFSKSASVSESLSEDETLSATQTRTRSFKNRTKTLPPTSSTTTTSTTTTTTTTTEIVTSTTTTEETATTTTTTNTTTSTTATAATTTMSTVLPTSTVIEVTNVTQAALLIEPEVELTNELVASVGTFTAVATVASSAPSVVRGLTILSVVADQSDCEANGGSNKQSFNNNETKMISFPKSAMPFLLIGPEEDQKKHLVPASMGAVLANGLVAPLVVLLLVFVAWTILLYGVKKEPGPVGDWKKVFPQSGFGGRLLQLYGLLIEGAFASGTFLMFFSESTAGQGVAGFFLGILTPVVGVLICIYYTNKYVLTNPDCAFVDAYLVKNNATTFESSFWRFCLGRGCWSAPDPEEISKQEQPNLRQQKEDSLWWFQTLQPCFGKVRGITPTQLLEMQLSDNGNKDMSSCFSKFEAHFATAASRSIFVDVLVTGILGAIRGYAASDPCNRSQTALILIVVISVFSCIETIALRAYAAPMRNVLDTASSLTLMISCFMAVAGVRTGIQVVALFSVGLAVLSAFAHRIMFIISFVILKIQLVSKFSFVGQNIDGTYKKNAAEAPGFDPNQQVPDREKGLLQAIQEVVFDSTPTVYVAAPAGAAVAVEMAHADNYNDDFAEGSETSQNTIPMSVMDQQKQHNQTSAAIAASAVVPSVYVPPETTKLDVYHELQLFDSDDPLLYDNNENNYNNHDDFDIDLSLLLDDNNNTEQNENLHMNNPVDAFSLDVTGDDDQFAQKDKKRKNGEEEEEEEDLYDDIVSSKRKKELERKRNNEKTLEEERSQVVGRLDFSETRADDQYESEDAKQARLKRLLDDLDDDVPVETAKKKEKAKPELSIFSAGDSAEDIRKKLQAFLRNKNA